MRFLRMRKMGVEMAMLASIARGIDSVSTGIGKAAAWLILPNVLALVYEFVARYVVGSPTNWSYEVTYFLYGSHFLLGAAFALSIKAHIRIDIFYQRFSSRLQAIIEIIGYLVFFFPAVGLLVYAGAEFTIQSFEMGEKSGLSPWRPYLYPYKAVVLSAIFFLFLQGIAEFIKNLKLAGKGKAL